MKSKLQLIMVFCAFLGANLFLFTVAGNGTAAAAPVDDARNDACQNKGDDKGVCEEGFNAGYNKASSGTININAACGEKPETPTRGESNDDLVKYNACLKGFEFGKATGQKKNKAEGEQKCKDEGLKGSYLDTCKDAYAQAKEGKSQNDTCGTDKFVKNSESQKACNKGWVLGAGRGANDVDNSNNPNCDLKFTSPLSWIVCPIVDMGTAFTDWIYGNFVRGLLEDVPVNPDNPNDGSTNAWKQFRILGNILLVGTLLMIVYSQAKGGGGGR